MNWFDENTPLIILDEKNKINIKKISDLYCIENIDQIQIWGDGGWVHIDKIEKRLLEENEKMIEIISPCGYFTCSENTIVDGDFAYNIKKNDCIKTTWNIPVNIHIHEENKISFYSIGKNLENNTDLPIDILNTTTSNQVLFFGGFHSTNSIDTIITTETQCKTQFIWFLARKLCYTYELIYIGDNDSHKIKRVRTQNRKIVSIKYIVYTDFPIHIYSIVFKKNENKKSYSVNIGVGEICIDIT
jgi:hypothetical protein